MAKKIISKSINEQKKKVLKELKKLLSKPISANFVCPYCESISNYQTLYDENEYKCKKCNKLFLGIMGQAKRREGSNTRAFSYGPPVFLIRLWKLRDDIEVTFTFNTNRIVDVHSGDYIYLSFMKKLFSNNYSDKPKVIFNATTKTYVVI